MEVFLLDFSAAFAVAAYVLVLNYKQLPCQVLQADFPVFDATFCVFYLKLFACFIHFTKLVSSSPQHLFKIEPHPLCSPFLRCAFLCEPPNYFPPFSSFSAKRRNFSKLGSFYSLLNMVYSFLNRTHPPSSGERQAVRVTGNLSQSSPGRGY